MMSADLLTIQQAAEIAGKDASSIRRAIYKWLKGDHARGLEGEYLSGKALVTTRAALQAWIANEAAHKTGRVRGK